MENSTCLILIRGRMATNCRGSASSQVSVGISIIEHGPSSSFSMNGLSDFSPECTSFGKRFARVRSSACDNDTLPVVCDQLDNDVVGPRCHKLDVAPLKQMMICTEGKAFRDPQLDAISSLCSGRVANYMVPWVIASNDVLVAGFLYSHNVAAFCMELLHQDRLSCDAGTNAWPRIAGLLES